MVLGVLFVWAALSKLANPTAFLATVYAYDLPMPQGAMKFLAVVLPWVELLAGLMLLAAWWTETALSIVALLLGVFLLVTLQAWGRGLKISCGCFNLAFLGLDEEGGLAKFLESPGFAFVRNLALAAVTWVLWRPVWRRWRTSGGAARRGD